MAIATAFQFALNDRNALSWAIFRAEDYRCMYRISTKECFAGFA